MNRFKFDYRSYRGRASLTDWLKRITFILAVLVAVGLSILYFAPDFFSNFSFSAPSRTDSSGNTSVQEPSTSQSDSSSPSQPTSDKGTSSATESEEEPEETTETTLLKAISVPVDHILDGSATQLAQQAGANGVVVPMKDDDGTLHWTTNQIFGEPFQNGVANPSTDTIKQWNQGELYTIAQFPCFRDDVVGRKMDHTLYTVSGYRWMDSGDYHWATPASEEVQDYYISLMVELAQLGFDEILLEHCGFPSQQDGSLGNIRYPSEDITVLMSQFLDKAAQALQPYETKLSIRTNYEILQVGATETGLTASALSGTISRLLVPEEELQLVNTFLTSQGLDTPPTLIADCTSFSDSLSYDQILSLS